MSRLLVVRAGFLWAAFLIGLVSTGRAQVTWDIDNTTNIGGNAVTTVRGNPTVVSTPFGNGLEFDGNDGIIVDDNPIVGETAFTMEMIFRPDPISNTANNQPRIFHVESVPGDPDGRSILEGRITETGPNASWYPDIFVLRENASPPNSLALIDATKTHPVGQWYHYAMTYDGTQLKGFIDHELVLSGSVSVPSMSDGQVSLGMRHNQVNFFVGAIAKVRFSTTALDPSEFLSLYPPGDYNRNGIVDGNDYQKWIDDFGTVVAQAGDGADGNGDGVVDAADYVFWRNSNPEIGSGAQAESLPEPSAAILFALGILALPTRTSHGNSR